MRKLEIRVRMHDFFGRLYGFQASLVRVVNPAYVWTLCLMYMRLRYANY